MQYDEDSPCFNNYIKRTTHSDVTGSNPKESQLNWRRGSVNIGELSLLGKTLYTETYQQRGSKKHASAI